MEIALREFPKLSNVQIGKLCGVDDKTIAAHRPANLGNSEVEKRTGLDGKERPAHREPTNPPREQPHHEEVMGTPKLRSEWPKVGPPDCSPTPKRSNLLILPLFSYKSPFHRCSTYALRML